MEKSSKMFPRHKGFAIISESFALNLTISVTVTNKQLFAPLQCYLKQNFLPFSVKLIEYFFSAVNAVSSNPCVIRSPRIKIFLSS